MAVSDKNLRKNLTIDQKAEFTDAFNAIDTDGSGKIDTAEVKQGLTMCGMRPTDEEVRDLINRFDVNGDGELELFEWLEMAAIMFLGADDSEEMNELFKLFSDRDTNSVTPDSLYKAMNRFLKGQSVTMDDAEELIRESGVELADGCIPVQSFEKIVRQLNIKLKV